MKVNLIKEAVYDLPEKKCSQVPFDVFVKMSSVNLSAVNGNNFPRVRIFENIDEFKQTENFDQYDSTKYVHIMKNGQICIFLKENESDVILEESKEVVDNGTTNSEENTGEEA